MGRTSFIRVAVVMAVVFVLSTVAFAEHLFGPDELDTTYGAYFRLRQETWSDTMDFNHSSDNPLDRNFWRLKTSVWYKNNYDKKYDFFVKLTNEAQYWMQNTGGNNPLYEDEIVFDNLYVGATKLAGLPLNIKIGRQDFLMTHGEGFLIMDGTPIDGSRTFYFNAAMANVQFGERANVDVIYISNQQTDLYLPSMFASTKRVINTSDEQGFVLYGRIKAMENLKVEPYYIYKTEESDPYQTKIGNADAGELDLHTVGARVVAGVSGFNIRGELAYQTGEYDDNTDREGLGGYAFVGRQYKDVKWSPSWELGYVYLSGDDPDSDKDEGFDPLFSRWPWLSELYVFTLINERGIAYWTNTQMIRGGVKLAFTADTSLDFKYNYIWADEESSATGETDKGHLPQIQLNHKFTDTIDGYLRVEHMIPGDYYVGNDNATFVRWQLQMKI